MIKLEICQFLLLPHSLSDPKILLNQSQHFSLMEVQKCTWSTHKCNNINLLAVSVVVIIRSIFTRELLPVFQLSLVHMGAQCVFGNTCGVVVPYLYVKNLKTIRISAS